MSTSLVTGGAGFIGSTLAHFLVEKGAKVTVVDAFIVPYGANEFNLRDIKKKITFIKGDVRSKNLLKKVIPGKDFVFHF